MRNRFIHLPMQQSGFTLIEIMVALAISALLLGGIVQVFSTLKQTDKLSNALSRIQESSRVAYDVITYDARLTSYIGCADPIVKDGLTTKANGAPIYNGNYVNSSLWGTDVTAAGWGTAAGLDMGSAPNPINGTGARNARPNSDVIRFQHLSTDHVFLGSNMSTSGSNIVLSSNSLGLAAGDLAVVANCNYGDLFKISSISSSPVTVTHTATDNNSANMTFNYTTAATVSAFISNTYFVASTGRTNSNGDPIYGLYLRDLKGNVNEVVEGVEFMRVLYGQKLNLSTQNVRYVPASDSTLDMSQVTSIKIAFMLTSTERVLDSDDTNRYTLLDETIANTSGTTITYPNDRRLRRVVNMTIQLQNRRI